MRAQRDCSRRYGFYFPTVIAAWSAVSCSSSATPAPQSATYSNTLINQLAQSPPPGPDDAAHPSAPSPMVRPTPTPAAPDDEPELVRRDVPATVIAGRDVSFGVDVIDEEMDLVRVEMGAHPEGAEFDSRTLTVRWHVPRTATGAQHFVVRVTEHPGAPNARTIERPIDVQVAAHAPVAGQPHRR